MVPSTFHLLSYDDLNKDQVYSILKLRNKVFVVEQNCAYQDIDDVDCDCLHIMAFDKKKLIAYARILPPMLNDNNYVSIGRIIVSKDCRNKGIGSALVKYAIDYSRHNFPDFPLHIKAQNYLEEFYKSLGFEPLRHYFLEDGLPHQEMVYKGYSESF